MNLYEARFYIAFRMPRLYEIKKNNKILLFERALSSSISILGFYFVYFIYKQIFMKLTSPHTHTLKNALKTQNKIVRLEL
jgi:hypothetical protein